MKQKIALLCGSLRRESYSRKVGAFLAEAGASFNLAIEAVDISDMPWYNEDLEITGAMPASWSLFRKQILSFDGILFVTPEYNRSLPAVLKNALDVGSRPWGESVWNGKPAGVISLSQGGIGGFGANHHLRQTLACLNVPAMAQPEAYLGRIQESFEQNQNTLTPDTREFLENFLRQFAVWVTRNRG